MILDPSEEGIRAFMELRKQGFIPMKSLVVIGVYHALERAHYLRSME
jgi:hypothetical protein